MLSTSVAEKLFTDKNDCKKVDCWPSIEILVRLHPSFYLDSCTIQLVPPCLLVQCVHHNLCTNSVPLSTAAVFVLIRAQSSWCQLWCMREKGWTGPAGQKDRGIRRNTHCHSSLSFPPTSFHCPHFSKLTFQLTLSFASLWQEDDSSIIVISLSLFLSYHFFEYRSSYRHLSFHRNS